MNAAENFTTCTARLVTETGCTVDQAINFWMTKLITERPDLAVITLRAMAEKVAA